MAYVYIDNNNSPINRTNVSATVTVPSATLVGDLLILSIMHRDVITSALTGWTYVDTAVVNYTGSSVQYETVYYKQAASGDASSSVTVTQASSARLECALSTFRPDQPIVFLASDTGDTASSSAVSVSFTPAETVFAVFSSSFVYSNSNEITYDLPFRRIVGSAATNRRQGVAWGYFDIGAYTNSADNGTTPFGAVGVISQFRIPEIPPTKGFVNQTNVSALLGSSSDARVNQTSVSYLWGISAKPLVNQLNISYLHRRPVRRIIGITD